MRSNHYFLFMLLIIGLNTGVWGVTLQEKTINYTDIKSINPMKKNRLTDEEIIPAVDFKINQYDSPPATFTGDFWDYGLDTNSNGRFDLLYIAMEINVTHRYLFRLFTELSRSGESFQRTVEFIMDPGINIVNISFEVPPIHKLFFSSIEPLSFQVSHVKIEYFTPPGTYWFSDSLFYPYITRGYSLNELDLNPFLIDSNAFLIYIADFEGWPGEGIIDDPYIINGSCINSINGNFKVTKTTNHIFLCNWNLTGGIAGIVLEDVRNAFITNNDISNYHIGIQLKDCRYITIDHNRFHTNNIGIQVGNMPYISVEPSNNVSIINNLFYNNHQYGVYINPLSQYNRIEGNDFFNNNPNGNSQAFDQGKDNIFVSNYWQSLKNEVQTEKYSIDGTAQNEDFAQGTTPNHLTNLMILTPNGGEVFTKQVVIQWLKVNDTFNQKITYSIFYSTDAGDSWDLLKSGVYEIYEDQNGKGTCRYVWEVGTVLSAGKNYLIQIIAKDPSGFITMDTSDTVFTIEISKSSHSQSGTSSSLQNESFLPVIQILSLGSILFFVVTLVIVFKRQHTT